MRTVLVIDDNLEVLETIAMILEEAGYNVVCCSEPHRAVSLCGEVNFDVVLCDLYIEDHRAGGTFSSLAGIEVMSSLSDQFPSLPIIAMSGMVGENTLQRMKNNGAVEVLAKPFAPEKLLRGLDYALGGQHAMQAS